MIRSSRNRWRPFVAGAFALAALSGCPCLVRAADLLDAYRLALAGDPVLSQAEATRQAAREGVGVARGPLLPQVSASLGYARTRTADGAEVGIASPSSSRQPALALSQTLFDLGRLAALRAEQARADSEDASYRAAQQALPVRVAAAYIGVLMAADTLAISQANEDAFVRQVAESEARYRAGLSALVDLDQARAYAASARANTIGARQALDAAHEALAELTGAPLAGLRTLREDASIALPEPADAQAWVGIALQNNPLIQSRRDAVVAAERTIDGARSGHWPTLTAGVDVGRPAVWPADGSGRDGRTIASVGLLLKLPLTDGGTTQSLVRQALAQRDAAQAALEAQRRQVARDVADQFRSVAAGLQQIEATRAAVASAAKALEAMRVGQQTGTRTMTDLLLAIQQLGAAQAAYSQARHRCAYDRLVLLQLAGTVGEADLAALNAQLI
ncbi:TolC family outer membrane protein [Caldimonas sp. KR1-144]|uniref:TolC family outer membrane protein n=1 Tax=Caldimonas sp. KR1-144 TaxID=3400911 RepID=UPI003C126C10